MPGDGSSSLQGSVALVTCLVLMSPTVGQSLEVEPLHERR